MTLSVSLQPYEGDVCVMGKAHLPPGWAHSRCVCARAQEQECMAGMCREKGSCGSECNYH